MLTNPDNKRLSELEAKWMDGSITDDEAKEYAAWYNEDQGSPIEIPESFAISKEAHSKRLFETIRPQKAKLSTLQSFIRVAAILVLVFGAVWFFKNNPYKNEKILEAQSIRFKNDVAPGHNGAVLTLSNGQQIILDTAGNGVVTMQGNDKVVKSEDGIVYDGGGTDGNTTILYNLLSTENGRKFHLTLPDGSNVWLNAASSIRFPLSFTGKERMVEITGEVYFEVKHNEKQPFRVAVFNQVVEDVGTSFNINAYKDEASIKTTLLEGSVKVSVANSNVSSLLMPGQQAELKEGTNQIKIRKDVDTDEIMAWKNGTFSFKDADIKTIMRQVARWYDVEITYQGNISDTFVADISQQESISKLLKLLEMTDRVHFRIDGKKITVTP